MQKAWEIIRRVSVVLAPFNCSGVCLSWVNEWTARRTVLWILSFFKKVLHLFFTARRVQLEPQDTRSHIGLFLLWLCNDTADWWIFGWQVRWEMAVRRRNSHYFSTDHSNSVSGQDKSISADRHKGRWRHSRGKSDKLFVSLPVLAGSSLCETGCLNTLAVSFSYIYRFTIYYVQKLWP